jgi:hypothetical protein
LPDWDGERVEAGAFFGRTDVCVSEPVAVGGLFGWTDGLPTVGDLRLRTTAEPFGPVLGGFFGSVAIAGLAGLGLETVGLEPAGLESASLDAVDLSDATGLAEEGLAGVREVDAGFPGAFARDAGLLDTVAATRLGAFEGLA